MSYRTVLLERRRQSEAQTIEPSVLDYIDLRNQQCLDAWRRRRLEYELARLAECPATAASATGRSHTR